MERPQVDVVTSTRVYPRSPLSDLPFAKVGGQMVVAALPTKWADDMRPARLANPKTEAEGKQVLEPLKFLDELEGEIEKAGGIEFVMVMPDDFDPLQAVEKEIKRENNDKMRRWYRNHFGLDV